MGNGTGIPWDLCPGTRIPGLGTGIGTDSPGTLGTGTNIAGTVSGIKSCGQSNLKLRGHLGVPSWDSRAMGPIEIFWNLCLRQESP